MEQEKKQTTDDAVEILHRLYYEGNPERLASLEEERSKLDIAQQVYDLREEAGLTQKQLAKQVGVSESVIRDLEDTEYEGDVFLMLCRIAKALGKQVEFRVVPLKAIDEAEKGIGLIECDDPDDLFRKLGI